MNTRTRTRLTPEARKKQLLEVARELILQDGLQAFTMEALARTANVSSPLVYNYFANRKETLRALLVHEYAGYTDKLIKDAAAATSFEEVVRIFVNSNFDHYAPGNIIPILDSQPEIASAIAASSAAHGDQIAQFLVSNAADKYQLPRIKSELVVSMSSGASIAAAQYVADHLSGKRATRREQAVDTVVAYILAGLEHIAGQES
ncbi:MAG: TetR/AcrR family transcriptional regulator [Pseudomonadota bacterium]